MITIRRSADVDSYTVLGYNGLMIQVKDFYGTYKSLDLEEIATDLFGYYEVKEFDIESKVEIEVARDFFFYLFSGEYE